MKKEMNISIVWAVGIGIRVGLEGCMSEWESESVTILTPILVILTLILAEDVKHSTLESF